MQSAPDSPCAAEPLEPRLLLAARVVGYIPEYRYGLFNNFDLSAVTHVNYFAITANANGSLSTSPGDLAHLDAVVAAAHARGRTVSVVIDPGSAFMPIAQNATALTAFANNITAFCTAHALDGVDLDWEPLGPPQSQINSYGTMINALRQRAPNLILTAAVNPITHVVPLSAVPSLSWINVMGYDIDYANHSSYSASISALVGWNNYGVPRDKLVLGMPFYGRKGTSWSNTQAATYSDILQSYAQAHAGAFPSPDADLADGWYYNGVTTIKNKTSYVANNGFGGVMVWELGQDQFDAQGRYTSYSLLPAIKNILLPAWLAASPGANYSLTTQSLTINSGTITFTGDAATTHANLNLVVGAGATVAFNASQHLAGLTLSGGTATLAPGNPQLSLNTLSITNNGTLNLATGRVAVTYTGPSPAPTVAGLLASGSRRGRWTGTGIVSSTAAADPQLLTGIGYTDNGQTLTLFATPYGDANLDGTVNADDAATMVLARAQGKTGWSAGNFNYDAPIDADDFILFTAGAARSRTAAAASSSSPAFAPATTATQALLASPADDLLA
jgi:hypothetical protein